MMDVKFLKGTAAEYTELASKNSTTFYYTTDDAQLYLGEIKLSNGSDLTAAIARIAKNEGDITTINTTLATIQGDESVEGSVKNLIKAAKTDLEGQISAVDTKVGSLESLETADKDNIVDAINSVLAAVGTGGTAAVVTMSESSSEAYAKIYTLKQGSTTIGNINIPKDMVVSSGTVEVDPVGQPAGTYIVLTLANATNDKLYINVGNLVDIYKAKAEAAQVQVAIDSETREISASIVAGSIGTTELADLAVTTAKIAEGNVTKSKLSTEVQNSLGLADSAVQSVVAGTNNGTISVDGEEVSVAGLKSAAFAEASAFDAAGAAAQALTDAKADAKTKADAALASAKTYAEGEADAAEANAKSYADGLAKNYATAAQGAKAETALQAADITTGSANGTIAVDGTDVAVKGLGSAAYVATTAFDASGSAATAEANAKAYADSLATNYEAKGAAATAAEAAQTAAINAAATDATKKANDAEANAKTYVNEALTWGTIAQ